MCSLRLLFFVLFCFFFSRARNCRSTPSFCVKRMYVRWCCLAAKSSSFLLFNYSLEYTRIISIINSTNCQMSVIMCSKATTTPEPGCKPKSPSLPCPNHYTHPYHFDELRLGGGSNQQPYFRALVFFNKKPEITDDFFHEHWKSVHADLTMQVQDSGVFLTRYVQVSGPVQFVFC